MVMKWSRKFFIFSLFLILLLAAGLFSAAAADKPADVAGTTPAGIARMSDEEVRKAFLAKVEEEASATGKAAEQETGPGAALGALLYKLGQESEHTQKNLRGLVGNIPASMADLRKIFFSFSADGTTGGALKNTFWVLFFIGIGLVVEKIFTLLLRRKWLLPVTSSGNNRPVSGEGEELAANGKSLAVLAVILPPALGLPVFFVMAYFSYFAFVWTDSPALRLLFLAILLTITIIRLIALLAKAVLWPPDSRLRLLPVGDAAAGIGCRVVVLIWGYIVTATMFAVVAHRLGARLETIVLIKALAATVLLAVTAAAVLLCRKEVAAVIRAHSRDESRRLAWGRQSLAPIWHFFALLYLVILWCLMIISVVDPGAARKGAFLLSFFILPIWLLADWLLQWLVKHTLISLRLYEDTPQSQPTDTDANMEQQGRELFLKVKYYARLALIVGIVFWVARLWGYTIPFISDLSGVLFDALIIVALALLFWKFVSAWIEKKIKESMPEGEVKRDDVDDEWGDATARGRSYTLLPIIRSFIGSILVIMVTLTILSSMGVDIGPLLAGAGVVGLAVGFGAQKIVSDIFSGVFYLLDDAFRVGEYLTAGGIMGTVEKISLRNVMLRHHRGMLQIVPYSQLGTITNYMRGGIIEKFSLDFPYDADIDKIRKIIKKVGQEMLEDPELGKSFIRPLRSQGVREIANSVMTIRVKFTAKPGAQFTIRREAFKRITTAMQAKGIQYAHRKVIVDLPSPAANQEDPARMQKLAQAAGAAAGQIFDEEEKLKQQLAREKSGA